jgi:hypothetical protein
MTDYRHTSGFKLQGQIIMQLIQIIEANLFTENINDSATGVPHTMASNRDFVINFIASMLRQLFANLNPTQIDTFAMSLFNHCQSWSQFKQDLRDLLINMKSIQS